MFRPSFENLGQRVADFPLRLFGSAVQINWFAHEQLNMKPLLLIKIDDFPRSKGRLPS